MYFEGTGAEILVESLIQAGVDVIFGVPGDTGVALYDVLSHRSQDIRHVLARDERAAASMADGYARVSNRVGVVEASSGGGATFLVGGLGEPYAASIPLLVITSDIHRSSRGSAAITEIDQQKLFSAVTKAQFLVESTNDMAPQVAQAIQTAISGRPGPVSLIVPEDVFDEPGRGDIDFSQARLSAQPESPSRDVIHHVAHELFRAYQPAFLLGSGVHLSETYAPVQTLAEQVGAGVATTIHGKGTFPESHPLSLGVAGANGAREYANEFLATADAILMVGTRANSTDTDGFKSPPRQGPPVFHIDIDPKRAGNNYPDAVPLVGDARTILSALLDHHGQAGSERNTRVRTWVRAQRSGWERQREPAPADGLPPRAVVELLYEVYGHRATVVGEPGTPTPYLSAFWETEGRRREVILPRGHGAMGFALPAAVGIALADPKRPVIALTTDGSFGMACGELDTVARLRIPCLILHLSNGSLGWIKALQHFYLQRRYFGVDLGSVDAVSIAEGFGISAERATTLEELRVLVERAAGGATPLFIDVPVPEEFVHVPPVAPWAAALAGRPERPVY